MFDYVSVFAQHACEHNLCHGFTWFTTPFLPIPSLSCAKVPLKDLMVSVGGEPARVSDVPYLTRQLPTAAGSSSDAAGAAAAGDSADLQDRAAAAK